MLLGTRILQKCCRADGQVVNGTRKANLKAELQIHSSKMILAHRPTPRWIFLSEFGSPVTTLLSVINYISGFQFLLLKNFQMATGTRAGMWDPWNDGTTALSLSAVPCTCAVPGYGLMFSAISSCFSSRSSGITFISKIHRELCPILENQAMQWKQG